MFYVKLLLFNIFFFKSVEFENNASDIMNPSIVTNTDIAKNSIWYSQLIKIIIQYWLVKSTDAEITK